MQIFKDKNACLKIRTSYFILCKYLKIKMQVKIFFKREHPYFKKNISSLRVCILKNNQCTR